jgi:lipopolysaccharide export system permease protein
VIIDFASHTSISYYRQGQLHLQDIVLYYLYVFASRAEILLPIALLIAFVKTVCTLNTQNELIALMASGIKVKTLMRPFLIVSLFCTLLLYANEQFLLPEALKKLRRLEDSTKHQRSRNHPTVAVYHLVLEDRSTLLYQNYDKVNERFFDVFWIPSIDNIYRMKYLSHNQDIPLGSFVDHFTRSQSGELLQEASYLQRTFPEIQLNDELLHSAIFDPDILSFSGLTEQIKSFSLIQNEKESKVLTAFYWKLAIPWLCFITIIGAAPYCVHFSRQLPVFLIYACTLFSLIAFYMFIDAALVVSKRQVIPPFIAIICPFLTVFGFFQWRFAKL